MSNVQITVAESVDVELRGGYYDKAGVLRDMFQNHLMQLLALVTMEPPASLDADAIRNEKVKIMERFGPSPWLYCAASTKDIVERRRGPDFGTLTFAALNSSSTTGDGSAFRFYLRSGKAMPVSKSSAIIVEFQPPPETSYSIWGATGLHALSLLLLHSKPTRHPTAPTMQVPDTGLEIPFGQHDDINCRPSRVSFCRDAYERLLLDALKGDASLFATNDGTPGCGGRLHLVLSEWESSPWAPLLPAPLSQATVGDGAALNGSAGQGGDAWRMGCCGLCHASKAGVADEAGNA